MAKTIADVANIKMINGVPIELTDAEKQEIVDERNSPDNITYPYDEKRQREYPSIGEQLDLLFHDMTAGKGTKDGEWYKAVAKVKTDNPKPE